MGCLLLRHSLLILGSLMILLASFQGCSQTNFPSLQRVLANGMGVMTNNSPTFMNNGAEETLGGPQAFGHLPCPLQIKVSVSQQLVSLKA